MTSGVLARTFGGCAILAALLALVLTAPEGPPSEAALALERGAGPGKRAPGDKQRAQRPPPPECSPSGRTVRRRSGTKRKVVALTFDDGPSAATNRFLRVLDRFDAHATFYVLGSLIPGREMVLQRAVAQGHSVGNHTLGHVNVRAGGATAKAQIVPTTTRIHKATGVRPCTFRPPYGLRTRPLDRVVRDQRMLSILWNVDPADFSGIPPELIARSAIAGIKRGNIILMHDGGGDEANTLAALPQILRAVKRRGFETVTVPELFGLNDRPQRPTGRP